MRNTLTTNSPLNTEHLPKRSISDHLTNSRRTDDPPSADTRGMNQLSFDGPSFNTVQLYSVHKLLNVIIPTQPSATKTAHELERTSF